MEQQHQLPLQEHNLQLSGNNISHHGNNIGQYILVKKIVVLTSTTDNKLAVTSANGVNTKSQLEVCVLLPSHTLMAIPAA